MRQLKQLFKLIFLIGICAVLTGCTEEKGSVTTQIKKDTNTAVAIRIDGREVSLQELDHSLQLDLYDIEEQRYELRLRKIYALIDKEKKLSYDDKKIEVFLKPPSPPRVSIPFDQKNIRGNPEAPVSLAVFCSFQSPHCKAIQPVLHRLLSTYQGWVSHSYFDFPLKFHREGMNAGMAARCAAEQGMFWQYHDALYVLTPEINVDSYSQLVRQLNLDAKKFEMCLSNETPKEAMLSDRDRALSLGLKNVPVIFINGLYLKGPREFEQYAYWIEEELRSMGIDPKEKYVWRENDNIDDRGLPVTSLPLTLLGISESSIDNRSRVLIEVEEAAAEYYTTGQSLLENVSLLRIHSNFVVIENGLGLEKLPLKGEEQDIIPLTYSRQHDKELRQRIEMPQGDKGKKLIEPDGVLTLGQEWLAKQLEQRELLEAKFTQAELEVEGHHLMRLEGVADNEFFTALGFEENDVLLRVNDSWVHSGQNELWNALASGKIIDVAFMRKGLPHRLQYVVEELGYFEEE
ncbi:hypothetical protein BTJ40_16240 [Microbulbifer sp. A4B17]|uniref:thioredoxin domain-containing protein n=1 Tax=Microbulbifer sp. A4B17 TaxID=359370 RepID=UPI000D52E115|nr:thioredoxin domain-containing protein [Microbulbifer sp. A4B17]AWF82257.1 hypothetical protein BTJ40_16240 [Microbulbifer sp. A4B17]